MISTLTVIGQILVAVGAIGSALVAIVKFIQSLRKENARRKTYDPSKTLPVKTTEDKERLAIFFQRRADDLFSENQVLQGQISAKLDVVIAMLEQHHKETKRRDHRANPTD